MMSADDTADRNDPFGLSRFTTAQEGSYDTALAELRGGQKRSHWMWFIFPQIDGLGHSPTARFYAIRSRDEARAYLRHPVLGPRLVACAEALLALEGRPASAIFGFPDDMKLRSSMTLFACVAEPPSVFDRVIDRYFAGERDDVTLRLVGEPAAP
jgi:uncharacterized protein (DUF1810 family)